MPFENAYFVAVTVILIVFYRNALYRFLRSRWLLSKLPGLRKIAYPIIGHTYVLFGLTNTFKYSANLRLNLVKNYNQSMCLSWLGPIPMLWIFNPEGTEVILRSSKHTEKSFMYDFLQCWLGTGLLTSKGKKWFQRRKLITPSFHFTILQDFLQIMNEQSKALVDKLQTLKKNNTEVDLVKCVTMCTLDIICETAMGKSVNAQLQEDSEYVEAVTGVAEILQNRIIKPWLWSDLVFTRTEAGIQQKRLLKTLHGFTHTVISDRMLINNDQKTALKSRRLAFLDVLLQAETEDGKKLSFSGIQEEVDTFMFEGHDTISAAITWCLYLLGRHPEIQRKAKKEIDDVIGNDDVINFAMDDLHKLEYLERVIQESLRLFPSVPILGRVTSEDCDVNGYKVPAGTQVVICTYINHRNPNVWKEPNKFDPDRFNKSNSFNRHPFAYIPFSAGPRNCIGQKFAVMEEKVILAQILHRYEVTSTAEFKDLNMVGDLILRSKSSLDLNIKERS